MLLLVLCVFLSLSNATSTTHEPVPACLTTCIQKYSVELIFMIQSDFVAAITTKAPFDRKKVPKYVDAVCKQAQDILDCLDDCRGEKIWDRVLILFKKGLRSICLQHSNKLQSIWNCFAKNEVDLSDRCFVPRCAEYMQKPMPTLSAEMSEEDWIKLDDQLKSVCQYLGCVADCGLPEKYCGEESEKLVKKFWPRMFRFIGVLYAAGKQLFTTAKPLHDCLNCAIFYDDFEDNISHDDEMARDEL